MGSCIGGPEDVNANPHEINPHQPKSEAPLSRVNSVPSRRGSIYDKLLQPGVVADRLQHEPQAKPMMHAYQRRPSSSIRQSSQMIDSQPERVSEGNNSGIMIAGPFNYQQQRSKKPVTASGFENPTHQQHNPLAKGTVSLGPLEREPKTMEIHPEKHNNQFSPDAQQQNHSPELAIHQNLPEVAYETQHLNKPAIPGPAPHENTQYITTSGLPQHNLPQQQQEPANHQQAQQRPRPKTKPLESMPYPTLQLMGCNTLLFSKCGELFKWLQADRSLCARMRQTHAAGEAWTPLETFLACELRLFCLRMLSILGDDRYERYDFHRTHNSVIDLVLHGLARDVKLYEKQEFLKDSDSQDILDEVEIFTEALQAVKLNELPQKYDPNLWLQVRNLVSHSDPFLKRIAQESIVLAMFSRTMTVLDCETLDRRVKEFNMPKYLDTFFQVLCKFDDYLGRKEVREKTASTFLYLRPELSPTLKYSAEEDQFYKDCGLENPFILMEISVWGEPLKRDRTDYYDEEVVMYQDEPGFFQRWFGGR